jgi:hypothetical protein
VLLKEFCFGTLYNMQGSNISDGCNSSIVLDIGVEEEITPIVSREKVMLWHQRLGHIKRRVFDYYMVKVWLKVCLIALWIFI